MNLPAFVLAAALVPGAAGTPPPAHNEAARAELRRILAGPEFRDARAGPRKVEAASPEAPAWLQTWGDRIARLWRALRDRLFPPRGERRPRGGGDSLFSRASLPFAVLFVAVGLFPILLAALRRRRRRAAPAPGLGSLASGLADRDDARRQNVSAWECEAEALARAGRYREAIRARYLGALSFLSERGLIRYEPYRTNWDYARSLAERLPGAAGPFERLTAGFDGAWYGSVADDPDSARRFFEEESVWRLRLRP